MGGGGRHIFLLKNMKQTPGSPTDRLWLALPCSFLGRFMAPRGNLYFFLGTHACPASLVPLREFRFSSAGWCGNEVRIAPLRGCYPVAYYEACIGLLLCALYVYRVYLQIRWRYGKLDVAALRLVFLVLGMLPLSLYCHPRFHQIMVLVQKSFFLPAFHLLHFHSHP